MLSQGYYLDRCQPNHLCRCPTVTCPSELKSPAQVTFLAAALTQMLWTALSRVITRTSQGYYLDRCQPNHLCRCPTDWKSPAQITFLAPALRQVPWTALSRVITRTDACMDVGQVQKVVQFFPRPQVVLLLFHLDKPQMFFFLQFCPSPPITINGSSFTDPNLAAPCVRLLLLIYFHLQRQILTHLFPKCDDQNLAMW